MPDKKLTDNEIIKALECCTSWGCGTSCSDCPLCGTGCLHFNKLGETLDLINRQKAEKQDLEIELKAMRGAANSYKAEIERLKDFASSKCEDCAGCTSWKCDCSNIKAEAYKEFAERLKEDWQDNDYYWEEADIYKWIDNLLKEMVGEDK